MQINTYTAGYDNLKQTHLFKQVSAASSLSSQSTLVGWQEALGSRRMRVSRAASCLCFHDRKRTDHAGAFAEVPG